MSWIDEDTGEDLGKSVFSLNNLDTGQAFLFLGQVYLGCLPGIRIHADETAQAFFLVERGVEGERRGHAADGVTELVASLPER
jgi:hypothetical protein